MHVYDYAIYQGDDIRPSNSKCTNAYVFNWRDPDSKIIWKVRQDKAQQYNIQIIYDLPKEGNFNDAYQVKIGDSVLLGRVNRKGTGNKEYIVAEKKLMRMNEEWEAKMSTDIIIDDLGEITLDTGTYKLELSAKDGIKCGELFRPRAVILNPLEKP